MSLLEGWRRQLAREVEKRDSAEKAIARLRQKIARAQRRGAE